MFCFTFQTHQSDNSLPSSVGRVSGRKVHLFKATVFPIVMYGCESCIAKKAERQRIDAFELCAMLEKTSDSPLDFKEIKPIIPKGNQS